MRSGKPAKAQVHGPATLALLNLERNLDDFATIVDLKGRAGEALRRAAKRVHASGLREIGEARKLGSMTAARLTRLSAKVERYGKLVQDNIKKSEIVYLWETVILVTCVEAYLQDRLKMAAEVEPALMARTKLRASYSQVLEAKSSQELATEMRAEWARRWVDRRRGPTGWIEGLKKLGVSQYADGLEGRLEPIWGIRHLVVHAAAYATPDFLRRHPGRAGRVGERVKVSGADIVEYLKAVSDFVNATDFCLLRRWPALLGVRED